MIKHLGSIATEGHSLYKNKLHTHFKAKAYQIKMRAPKAWATSNQSCGDKALFFNIMSPPKHLKSGIIFMFVYGKDFPSLNQKAG